MNSSAEPSQRRDTPTNARPATDNARILIVIPCYNEASSIRQLIEKLRDVNPDISLVVVDDGSEDGTLETAQALCPVIHLSQNLGIGAAVQTGLRYARERAFQICIQVDGDGQHSEQDIPRLVEAHFSSGADIIVGSRFLDMESHGFRSTFSRRIGISVIRAIIRLLFGCRVTDPTSGLRLMNAKAVKLFTEQYPQDFPEPISLAIAIEHGLRISEIGVKMHPRLHGQSSITGHKSLIYMLKVVGYLSLIRASRLKLRPHADDSHR